MIKNISGGALVLAILVSSHASAGIVGDSVNLKYEYPDSGFVEDLGTQTIQRTGNLFIFNEVSITVDNNTVNFSFTDPIGFSDRFAGFVLTDNTGAFSAPYQYYLPNAADALSADRIVTNGNTLSIDLGNLSYVAGDSFALVALAPVAEPETSAMLAVGMGLVGLLRRRGRSARAAVTA